MRVLLPVAVLASFACVGNPGDVAAEDAASEAQMRLPAAEGGLRRWVVTHAEGAGLQDAPAAVSSSTYQVAQGQVLNNLGCSDASGVVWCEVTALIGVARGFVTRDALGPARGPDDVIAFGPNDTPKRIERGEFDAEANVPCQQSLTQPVQMCALSVARAQGGDASIRAEFPNGFSRLLYFEHGLFLGANTTMSGTGSDIEWRVSEGFYQIRVDDQKYDIPAQILFGP